MGNTSIRKFLGARVDSGVQNTFICINLSQAYCSLINLQFVWSESKCLVFTFWSHQHRGMGIFKIRPVFTIIFLSIESDVLYINVPFLLWIDVLTSSWLILYFSDALVQSKSDVWWIPLIRKNIYASLTCNMNILYTSKEGRSIHRFFYHLNAESLYGVHEKGISDRSIHRCNFSLGKYLCYLRRIKQEGDVRPPPLPSPTPHSPFQVSLPD